MFTGIITDVGTIRHIEGDEELKFSITSSYDVEKIPMGASIACNGVCLTVMEKKDDWFAVNASPYTLEHTTIKNWKLGDKINLERALCVGDELGGHWVTGHVDTVAEITQITPRTEAKEFSIKIKEEFLPFVATRGSLTLDGTSLTITWVNGQAFGITLVPHTLQVTTWGNRQTGDKINVEIDVLARYIKRMQEATCE